MGNFVLVVDDDSACCREIADSLARRGYVVRTAGNGREAFGVIAEFGTPRLIITDLEMPVMTGAELRLALRNNPELAAVPVVLCSSVAGLDAYAAALQCSAYIPKPVNPLLLGATVRTLVPQEGDRD